MTCSKLKFSLANDALIHFFRSDSWAVDEIYFLNTFCRNFSDRFWKFNMRLLYEENNVLRFDKNFSFVKIGMNLHLHPNALQRWRDKFLNEISSLMNFDLPIDDIFSRNKIEALIFGLERNIVFFEDYGKTDYSVLLDLKSKLELYQDLLFAIRYFLNSNSFDVGDKIIQAKILNPNFSAEELEKVVGFSHTTISKYLLAFRDKYFSIISKFDV